MNTITNLTKTTPFRIDGNQTLSLKEVLSTFFETYDLHDVQNHMWQMMKIMYIGKSKHQPTVERENLIGFHENLSAFLNMCYLSNQANKQETNKALIIAPPN